MADEPNVVFSVKELIGRLDGKLDTITNILTSKADRSDVIVLEHRVGQVEEKVGKLQDRDEIEDRTRRDQVSRKRWMITTAIAVAVAIIAVAGIIVQGLLH